VVGCEDRLHGAGICSEAALENNRGFRLLEGRETTFELDVERHGAGDRAHRAGADTELANGGDGALREARVRREPEVVVRRQINDVAPVEPCGGLLTAFEHAKRPSEAR